MTAPQAIPGLPGQTAIDGGGGDTAVLRSLGRCFGLTLISGGLWAFAWIYHTAKEVSPRVGENANAGGRTVGFIVPILNWFVLYWSWRDIDTYAKRSGSQDFPVVLFLILGIIISPLMLVFYFIVQSRLNAAHVAATGGAATKAPMYKADWIAVILGVLAWVVGILLIILVAANSDVSTTTSY